MKGFLHIRIPVVLALVAAAWALFSCQEPKEEESGFLVNQKKENSTFPLAPEGGDFQLFVVSDAEWTYKPKTQVPWLSIVEQKVNSTSWMLTLTAQEYIGEGARSVVLVFTSGNRTREVTVLQEPEDPQLQVLVPGAYGVEGGSIVYERGQAQISRLTDGDSYQFSLLYPAEVKAVSITVPSALEAGADVSVGYKVVEKDRTLVMTGYTARVLRIREPYVWLKVDDTVYFVIKK